MHPDPVIHIFVLLAAPFIGSFLAVVAVRYPQARSALTGKSRCDYCDRTIEPLDLIPVLSFVRLAGRCRTCGAAIKPLHLVIEIAAFLVALTAALVTSGSIFLVSVIFGWTLLLLAAIDWETYRLPDVLTYPLAAAGLAVGYVIDRPSFIAHVIGAVAGFVVFALLTLGYRALRGREGLGLGDAKLLAAAGAWLTWVALPTVVFLAAILALLAIGVHRVLGQRFDSGHRVAFGPALAAAIWFVWLAGPLLPV